jgi:hypothetical protein
VSMRGITAGIVAGALAMAGGLSFVPAVQAANGSGSYAQWTRDGTSGTITIASAGFASPSASWSTNAGNLGVATSATLGASTPFGQRFGTSSGKQYLGAGLASGLASSTTYTFTRPAPAGTWGFAFGDIDADFVVLSATDAVGAAVPVATIGTWFQGAFNYAGGTDVPTWNPATATLTGTGNDTNGAAGWFIPTVSVSSLTVTFDKLTGFPTYQTWIAGDGPTAPQVATQPATSVTSTAATLNGTVNANWDATSELTIRYGADASGIANGGGTSAVVAPAQVTGGDVTTVSADVSGLQPGTTYYYRVAATNTQGTDAGAVLSFTTLPLAPIVLTGTAIDVTSNDAVLTGSVNAQGFATTPTIRYGTDEAVVAAGGGSAVATSPATVDGSSSVTVSAPVTDLLPNTTYYFQVSAVSAQGSSAGIVVSFTTPGIPPGPPGTPSVLPGDGEIIAIWTPPTDSGSSPVTGYEAVAEPGGNSCSVAAVNLSCSIEGLTNGATYTVSVIAESESGTSVPSADSVPVTPQAEPDKSILITGSRADQASDHDRVNVAGFTTGFPLDLALTPMVKVGDQGFEPGTNIRSLAEDGTFEWTRRVRADKDLSVYFTDGEINSNTVVLPATPTIMITGSRDSGRVFVSGVTEDIKIGTLVTPIVSVDGGQEAAGVNERRIRSDRTFTWQRKVGGDRPITVFFTGGGATSNPVSL